MYRVDAENVLQNDAQKQCKLIADLFNLYLPNKIEVGGNIWRFIVFLTADKKLDGKTEIVGLCQDSYVFCDSEKLIGLDALGRKNILLKLFIKGLKSCCSACGFYFEIFSEIENRIIKDGIVFNGFFKERKINPDRSCSVQMKAYLSEYVKELSIAVFNESGLVKKEILIGNFDFRHFDRIKWADTSLLNIYEINFIQSYKRKRVAEDYFSVNIESGIVTYVPVTRESVFERGIKLLTETDQHKEALTLIEQAKKLGHGKAENVLQNLTINPTLRNRATLLQAPKRK